jgi:pimeloyl-ACP methyl ester carboxylesterase
LFDAGGARIAVHDSGAHGPPVVLLHGNSLSSRGFQRQLEGRLGASYRLLAIDFPGHGASGKASDPATAYSIPALARVVADVANALDAASAAFVGWSLGGHVLLEATALLDRAAGFCIFGAPPLAVPPAMDEAFLAHPAVPDLFKDELTDDQIRTRVSACLRPGAPIPDEFVDDVRSTDRCFRSALLASLGGVGYRDEVEIVAALDRPLAVFHGVDEQIVNAAYLCAVRMPTLWRGCVQLVDGAGHSPQWESPGRFDALLSAFVHDTATC